MKRSALVLVCGLLLGVVATVFLLGKPLGRSTEGLRLKPPDNSKESSGTVTVTIDEKFFDSLLSTLFQKLGPPQLKLTQNGSTAPLQPVIFQGECNNVVMLAAEDGDVKTGVRFTGGKITAPVAFAGSYSILGRCTQFKGWTRTTVELSFDQDKQTVFGQLNIEEITLDDTSPIVSSLVTPFVRRSITERVNPFEVLRVSQLALALPIRASGGSLKAHIKDVRSDVQEGALRLYLIYDFNAEKDAG